MDEASGAGYPKIPEQTNRLHSIKHDFDINYEVINGHSVCVGTSRKVGGYTSGLQNF